MPSNSDLKYIEMGLNYCLSLLSQARTRSEIERKLSWYLDKTVDNESTIRELSDSIIFKLDDMGLIDDEDYCSTYIKQKLNSPNIPSKMEINKFLYRKGIDKNLISKYLDELYTFDLELNAVTALAERKHYNDVNKLKKYLLNKGFSYDVVSEYFSSDS